MHQLTPDVVRVMRMLYERGVNDYYTQQARTLFDDTLRNLLVMHAGRLIELAERSLNEQS